MADRFEEVTVLFADIYNFNELSRRTLPSEQINLLNRLFSAFDDLVEQYGVEKIKTLRDLYIVAAGVPSPQPNHAAAIAQLALAMQQTATQFQSYLSEPLQLRIGINTGSVVAGVIGTKKFTYDLWGDTVDLANWMQLHATPGKIQVTSATYEQLQNLFGFEQGRIVEIPGLGDAITYCLQGSK
jgi:class 3 adenylate cyclase